MQPANYQTAVTRVAAALIIGTMVGGGVATLERITLVTLYNPELARSYDLPWWWGAGIGLVMWLYTSSFFGIGIMVIGAPAWWLLDRFKRKGWIDAIVAGISLTFLTYYCIVTAGMLPLAAGPYTAAVGAKAGPLIVDHEFTARARALIIQDAAWVSLAGGISAWAIWRIAYRRL